MNCFNRETAEYLIKGKSDEQVMESLRKDSFNLVCEIADALIEKSVHMSDHYAERVLNIVRVFRAMRERGRQR